MGFIVYLKKVNIFLALRLVSGVNTSYTLTLVLQSTVALSTIEAKYMVVTEAFKKAIWLCRLIEDSGIGNKTGS